MQYCGKNLQKQIRVDIYQYRKRHNLTQREMAELLRISLREYINNEHGIFGFSALSVLSFLFLILAEENGAQKAIALLESWKKVVEEAEQVSD